MLHECLHMLLTGSEGEEDKEEEEGGKEEGRGGRQKEKRDGRGETGSMNRRNCLVFFIFYEGRLNAFKVAAWLFSQRFQFGCAINKVQSSVGQR